jgi:hypothetical protein
MIKLCSLAATFVATGALVVGCGSTSSSSTPTTSKAPAVATTSTPAAATTSHGATATPTVAAGLAACKADAARSPLSGSLKAKYLSVCEQALSGHEAGVKQAGAQLCQQIAKALPTAERAAALAECPKP